MGKSTLSNPFFADFVMSSHVLFPAIAKSSKAVLLKDACTDLPASPAFFFA
jgi:hypothetical protein